MCVSAEILEAAQEGCGGIGGLLGFDPDCRYMTRPGNMLAGLGFAETGELHGFEVSGGFISPLDASLDFFGQIAGQAKAVMDSDHQPVLNDFIVLGQNNLERRDHIANDVFRGIMQQAGQSPFTVDAGVHLAEQPFHQNRVLGNAEGPLAPGLAVPA